MKDSLIVTNISEEPSASMCKLKYALALLVKKMDEVDFSETLLNLEVCQIVRHLHNPEEPSYSTSPHPHNAFI